MSSTHCSIFSAQAAQAPSGCRKQLARAGGLRRSAPAANLNANSNSQCPRRSVSSRAGCDGAIEMQNAGSVDWAPPAVGPGCRLMTTPDGMYAIVPGTALFFLLFGRILLNATAFKLVQRFRLGLILQCLALAAAMLLCMCHCRRAAPVRGRLGSGGPDARVRWKSVNHSPLDAP